MYSKVTTLHMTGKAAEQSLPLNVFNFIAPKPNSSKEQYTYCMLVLYTVKLMLRFQFILFLIYFILLYFILLILFFLTSLNTCQQFWHVTEFL